MFVGRLGSPLGEVQSVLPIVNGLEDGLRGEGAAIDLQHALLKDKVLAPGCHHIRLDGAACRAIVVEARDTWTVQR